MRTFKSCSFMVVSAPTNFIIIYWDGWRSWYWGTICLQITLPSYKRLPTFSPPTSIRHGSLAYSSNWLHIVHQKVRRKKKWIQLVKNEDILHILVCFYGSMFVNIIWAYRRFLAGPTLNNFLKKVGIFWKLSLNVVGNVAKVDFFFF